MNYLSKLRLFSLKECCYVIVTSVAKKFSMGKLKNIVPSGLLNFQGLLVALDRQKITVTKYYDLASFGYLINNHYFKIFLKRNSSDSQVFKGVVMNRDYAGVVDLILKHKIPCDIAIDAGANIGLTSIYFKAYFPAMKIICLEPSSDTFRRLKKNIDENNILNVHLLKKGLWSCRTTLFADRSFRDGADWSFRLSNKKADSEDKIETLTVADIIESFNAPVIDILKIDIEGAEVEVFKSKDSLNWLTKVRLICMEIHDEFDCREMIENTLVYYGFTIQHSGELTIGMNNNLF